MTSSEEMEEFFKSQKKPVSTVKKKNMDFLEGFNKLKLSPYGDKDKDGVPNWDDCKPFDPNRDGWIMDRIRGKRSEKESSESERLIAAYKAEKQKEKYEGTTTGHSTSDKLTEEYHKKYPEKKSLMERLADQRAANARDKADINAIYRAEFNKQRAISVKARARDEARDRYRPTRKQKMDSFANAIGNLGGMSTTKQHKHKTSSKKKHNKPKYTIIHGKAYPVAGSSHNKKHQKKKTKRKTNDAFDFGNFDFDF